MLGEVSRDNETRHMNLLIIILIIVGVLLVVPGLIVGTLKFLLWIGIILVVIGLIVWLVRSIRSPN